MATARYIRTMVGVASVVAAMYLGELFVPLRPGVLMGAFEVLMELAVLYSLIKRRYIFSEFTTLPIFLSLFFASLIVADVSYVFSFYLNALDQRGTLVSFMTDGFYALAFLMMALAFITSIRTSFWHLFRNPVFFISLIITTVISVKFSVLPFWHSITGEPMEMFYVVQALAIIAAYFAVFLAFVTFLGARDIFWILLSIGMLILGLEDWAVRIESILGYDPYFGFYEYYWAAGIGFLAFTVWGQQEKVHSLELLNFESLLNTYKLGALLTVLLFVGLIFVSGATILSLKMVILSFMVCVILAGLISQLLSDKHQRFLDITIELVSDRLLLKSSDPGKVVKTLPIELQESFAAICQRRISDIKLIEEKEAESRMANAKHELASQVAHDIRSPLAALDSALKNTTELPEEKRVMVRHAVNRIRDIANNLLEKNRQRADAMSEGAAGKDASEVWLLSSLIEPVITEKRLQFELKKGVDIDFELSQESYGLFARIRPVEFKRIISNLVNNAVEAIGTSGKVVLGVSREGGSVLVRVSDNGRGMTPEIVAKLGRKGETHGKSGGSGLGLYHARTMVEDWNGSLDIVSLPGQGTVVTMKIPEAEASEGFVPRLELVPGGVVVVLDDDPSIHQVWRERFERVGIGKSGIEELHFSEPEALRGWVKSEPEKAGRAIYLFDYELLNFRETGLSLAQELGLASRVVLVTNRHEETEIIARAVEMGVRILPKGLVGFVPVEIKAETIRAAVLIDDDQLVHMNWKIAARNAGVGLACYKGPEDFEVTIGGLAKDTPVYIDSELDGGMKGEEIALRLHERGFCDITMATGYDIGKFAHLPWLKVRGKEPPWK